MLTLLDYNAAPPVLKDKNDVLAICNLCSGPCAPCEGEGA